jgi:ribonuclease T2
MASRLAKSRNALALLLLLTLLTACSRPAREAKPSEEPASQGSSVGASSRQASTGNFDYYLLVLSWAPEFCATHAGNASSSECDPTHHFGYVVHGMWPQNNDGSYPQNCTPARPVSQAIVQQMLPIMPARGLIQHEWATHGTCSGLTAQDYFADITKAYNALQVPADLRAPEHTISASPSDIEQKMADANHAPKGAFRVSCSKGELVALEACLGPDLQYRDCGPSLRDCRAPQVSILPVP